MAPRVINTTLKPRMKLTEFSIIFCSRRDSCAFSSSTPTPEISDTYPGTSGKTQGERNDTRPATKAAIGSGRLVMQSLFYLLPGLTPAGSWFHSVRRGPPGNQFDAGDSRKVSNQPAEIAVLIYSSFLAFCGGRSGRRRSWLRWRRWRCGWSLREHLVDKADWHNRGYHRTVLFLLDFQTVKQGLHVGIGPRGRGRVLRGAEQVEKNTHLFRE